MNKYNKNRADIGDPEIESTENFGKLMAEYNIASPTPKPKLYNKPLQWSAAASIIVVVGIIAYNYIKKDSIIAATKSFVNPPVAGVNIPTTTLKINAETGGTITLPSGSMIEVPANAFVNADGSMVKGIIDLKYREFNKPTDFFVSGIPMTYDSAGTKYTFESAGMFDLTGFAGSNPIKIADGKSLNVKMNSVYKDDRYNMYLLDTIKKSWAYLGKSEMEKPKVKKENIAAIEHGIPDYKSPKDMEMALAPLMKPKKDFVYHLPMTKRDSIDYSKTTKALKTLDLMKPRKRNLFTKYVKTLTIPSRRFPELEMYGGTKVMFEFEKNKGFFPEDFPDSLIIVNKIERSKEKPGYYTIWLIFKNDVMNKWFMEQTASPVFDEEGYTAAMEIYNKAHERYTGKLKELEEGEALALPKDFKPVKPTKSIAAKNTFKLAVNPNQFPELGVYKDVVFEIPEAQFASLPPNFEDTVYDNVRIYRSKNPGYYDFTLVRTYIRKDPKIYSITNCRPVFKDKDYAVAMETYNKLYTQYQSRYKGKMLNEDREQKQLNEAEIKGQEAYAKYEKSKIEFAKKQAEAWEKQNKTSYIQSVGYRVFQVREFGMYNSDCPSNMPTGATVLASVTDDKGKPIPYNSLYMVDHGRNALYTISSNNGRANLSYNPESSTTFWIVTYDGKIAKIGPEEVKKLSPSEEGITPISLAMHISDKELKTEKEISAFLDLN